MESSPTKRQRFDDHLVCPKAAVLSAKAGDWETALLWHKQALVQEGDAEYAVCLGIQHGKLVVMAAQANNVPGIEQLCELATKHCCVRSEAAGYLCGDAIMSAVHLGHLKALEVLWKWWRVGLDSSIKPRAAWSNALITAVINGRLEVLRFMCKLAIRAPDLGIVPSPHNDSVVYIAVNTQRLDVVEYLLKAISKHPELRIDPAAQNNRALHAAADKGYVDMVRVLCACPAVDPSVLFGHGIFEVRHIATTAHKERKRWSELRVGWLAALTSSWKP
jgi:hypothetical protein